MYSSNDCSESLVKRQKTGHVHIKQEEVDDDDDMFGDDLELEELQDMDAILGLTVKKEATVVTTIQPTEPVVPHVAIPIKQEPSLVDTSDIFDDDFPLEDLDQVMAENNAEPEKRRKFIRYLVACVTDESYMADGSQCYEKVILLIQEDEKKVCTARLRGDWIRTVIEVGNVVHIPNISLTVTEVIIDNKQHFIVVHPDRLISCTAVADSFLCIRKSIFQLKVRSISEYAEAMVHGNIIHRVLQNALKMGDFQVASIKKEIVRVVLDSLQDLYAMDQDEETAILILNEYAESISRFGSTFVNKQPKARANTDIGQDPALIMGFENISISNVLDIEEHLWSATYGLKGMIDASVQLKMSKIDKVLTVPFELKTGKSSKYINNRAQTLLYTLLMSDRYDVDVGAGILYYSKTNSLYVIPSSRDDLRSLIIARNALAIAFNQHETVPPMLKDIHKCQYCVVADACTVYHKAFERGTGLSSGLFQLFDEKTDHMTETTSQFFMRWWKLLDKEETDVDYIRKDIWSQPADIREQLGKCLSNLQLYLPGCDVDPAMSRFVYTFHRHASKANAPLLTSLQPGDPIVVSSMEGHVNLSMGYVHQISLEKISLLLTEPLRNPPQRDTDFDPLQHQSFRSFIRHKSDVKKYYSLTNIQYRIDRDEMSIGMGMLRNNLVELTMKDGEGSARRERLRQLIIDLEKPDFSAEPIKLPPTPNMNLDQRNALKRILQANDYSLILGMPGTGKTTTTAEIIKYLVSQGKTVLVAAYTHTALDNVLCKVREKGVDVLRLGNVQRVMPSLRDCVPGRKDIKTVKEMQDMYDSRKVVGITCLGIGDVLLQKRKFDYCIIDEASQITLPTCIGPLRYAKTFVLVGDLYQLPPIVRDKDACEMGLDKSLFSILSAARPEAISYLEYQYRMNSDIMDITNLLVYGGKLKCGNNETATRQLNIPNLQASVSYTHRNQNQLCKGLDCWLRYILDPSRKVIFVNTDALEAKEIRPFGSLLHNEIEAKLILQATEAFIQSGITEEQMALISVYRSQLRVISQGLKHRQGIEIATIDKYQGRDKDCVIISLVRNNTSGNAGDLLRDWRRLNVAITRAKSKLILFGSSSTLKSTTLYHALLESFEEKGWVLNLPHQTEKAHEMDSHRNENPDRKPLPKKPHLPTQALLRKNEVLRDVYNNQL